MVGWLRAGAAADRDPNPAGGYLSCLAIVQNQLCLSVSTADMFVCAGVAVAIAVIIPSTRSSLLLLPQGSSVARDMRTSIHRCLVFLGDLARYASQAAPKAAAAVSTGGAAGGGVGGSGGAVAANTAAKAEWTRAIAYYRMAAQVGAAVLSVLGPVVLIMQMH